MAIADTELRERCVAIAEQAMQGEGHRGTPAEPAAWREHSMAGGPAIYEIQIEEGTQRALDLDDCWIRLMTEHGLIDEALRRAIVTFLGTGTRQREPACAPLSA